MFNPKKWNALCWALLLIWLLPTVARNVPYYDSEIPEPHLIELPDGQQAMAYGKGHLIGWPFVYLEVWKEQNKPIAKTYRPMLVIANFFLVLITLIGIIYSIQTLLPRYSIRTFIVVFTLVVFLLPVCNLLFSLDNYFVMSGTMYCIYFAPLITMCLAYVYTKRNSQREIRGITHECLTSRDRRF